MTDKPDANTGALAKAIMDHDLDSGAVKSPPQTNKLVVHIMPGNIDKADKIAADLGFGRVDDELDRRVYAPMSADE